MKVHLLKSRVSIALTNKTTIKLTNALCYASNCATLLVCVKTMCFYDVPLNLRNHAHFDITVYARGIIATYFLINLRACNKHALMKKCF